jgi:hypothetical protein
MGVREEHLDTKMANRLPRLEPLRLFDAKALPKQAVVPLDVSAVAVDELVIGIQNHEQVTPPVVIHAGLVVAANKSGTTRSLRRGEPSGKRALPASGSTATPIQWNPVPPIGDGAIDWRLDLEEAAILTREGIALKKRVGHITRGHNTMANFARAGSIPPRAESRHANRAHAGDVADSEVMERRTIDTGSLLVLEITPNNAPGFPQPRTFEIEQDAARRRASCEASSPPHSNRDCRGRGAR